MRTTIFQVMQTGGSVIWNCEERGQIVTFNGGHTFNRWSANDDGSYFAVDCWVTSLDAAKVWDTRRLWLYVQDYIACLEQEEATTEFNQGDQIEVELIGAGWVDGVIEAIDAGDEESTYKVRWAEGWLGIAWFPPEQVRAA